METREVAVQRLKDDIETGRPDEVGRFLLEYLADWGPDFLDVQELAARVIEREDEQ